MAYWRPAEIAPVVFLANANMAAIALEMITFLKAAFQVGGLPSEQKIINNTRGPGDKMGRKNAVGVDRRRGPKE